MGPRSYSQHQLGAKVEMVYSLLSMLGTQDRDEMTRTLLAMSSSPESCLAMRQSGKHSPGTNGCSSIYFVHLVNVRVFPKIVTPNNSFH